MQLVSEHLATVISAHLATVDWSWPNRWNWCVPADIHFKKKKKASKEKAVIIISRRIRMMIVANSKGRK